MTGAAAILLAQIKILTLAGALQAAATHQPQIRLARANSDVARARVGEARAAILPQLQGSASYQRTTANFAQRPGLLPNAINSTAGSAGPSLATFNFFNFSLSLSQFVWDFRAPFVFRAASTTAEAQAATEQFTRTQVLANVRAAFFAARAQKALVAVARETLVNQGRHRDQVRGFVEVGRQPQIALAQVETDYANAEVQSISAANAYVVAKAQLDQAMGVEGPSDYEVADEAEPPVEGEQRPLAELIAEAMKARADLRSLERSLRAQALTVTAAKGGYGPTIGFTTALTDVGTSVGNLTWNWNATVTANWTFFDGLLTWSQVKEASATERGLEAQRDALRQQIVLDVSQAELALGAARSTLGAADKALENARVQLRLAEGRFTEGAGNIIELDDAQLSYTLAAAQRVQAQYNLASARAQLLRALGRDGPDDPPPPAPR